VDTTRDVRGRPEAAASAIATETVPRAGKPMIAISIEAMPPSKFPLESEKTLLSAKFQATGIAWRVKVFWHAPGSKPS